jgi:outer membrane protein OmpA-like peptidoglycan-associated protein
MKTSLSILLIICAGLLAGCSASAPPGELLDARMAYRHAAESPAAQLVPAELHKAEAALAIAEESFKNDPNSFTTRDLSYVADRKAKTAEALATTVSGAASTAQANKDYQETQSEIMIRTQKDLAAQTEITKNANANLAASERNSSMKSEQLAASERSSNAKTEQLAAEQKARIDAENQAAKAQADLAKLAAVKEEARGLVITLSGSVLFASNKSELLPSAQTRLNQVVDALLETKERTLIVEGHTDSQGSLGYNQELSQRRADAVRSYIISRGYSADLIQAHGIGKDRPVADNGNAEGRANNRRVEIIVAAK